MSALLTRGQVLTMPAGRDMDALVNNLIMRVACQCGQRTPECLSRNHLASLRRYSAEIDAAWEVVEHFTAAPNVQLVLNNYTVTGSDKIGFEAQRYMTREGKPAWFAIFSYIGGIPMGEPLPHGVANECETVSLAICRAALATTLELVRAPSDFERLQGMADAVRG